MSDLLVSRTCIAHPPIGASFSVQIGVLPRHRRSSGMTMETKQPSSTPPPADTAPPMHFGSRIVPTLPTVDQLRAAERFCPDPELAKSIYLAMTAEAPRKTSESGLTSADYEATLTEQRALTRKLDWLLNGTGGAGVKASLSELVAQVEREKIRSGALHNWKPMETAPQDGREVLLTVKMRAEINGNQLVGHYMPGGHCIEDPPPAASGWYFWNGMMFDNASEPIAWTELPPSSPIGKAA
jgi:hypothetical protein